MSVFSIAFLLMSYSPYKISLKKKWITMLSIPVILYFLISYLDYIVHPREDIFLSGRISTHNIVWMIIATFLRLIVGWAYAGLFPLMQKYVLTPAGRMSCLMTDYKKLFISSIDLRNPLNYIGIIAIIISLIILTIAIISIVRLLQKRRLPSKNIILKNKLKFLFLSICLISTFLIIVIVGRVGHLILYARDIFIINMYYSYISWIFYILIIYILFGVGRIKELLNTYTIYMKHLSIIIIFSLSLLNGYKVLETNQKLRELFNPTREFIEQVNRFIGAHKNEKELSFVFINRSPADIFLWYLEGPSEKSKYIYYLSDILYKKYIGQTAPKYHLDYSLEIRKRTEKEAIYNPKITYLF